MLFLRFSSCQKCIAIHIVSWDKLSWYLSYREVTLLLQPYKKISQILSYSKTCVKQPLSKGPKIGFQYQLSLNAGQMHCSSATLLTFIKLPNVIKIFVLSIFESPFYTSFTVNQSTIAPPEGLYLKISIQWSPLEKWETRLQMWCLIVLIPALFLTFRLYDGSNLKAYLLMR